MRCVCVSSGRLGQESCEECQIGECLARRSLAAITSVRPRNRGRANKPKQAAAHGTERMDGSNRGNSTQIPPPMMQACLWKRSPCGQRHIHQTQGRGPQHQTERADAHPAGILVSPPCFRFNLRLAPNVSTVNRSTLMEWTPPGSSAAKCWCGEAAEPTTEPGGDRDGC